MFAQEQHKPPHTQFSPSPFDNSHKGLIKREAIRTFEFWLIAYDNVDLNLECLGATYGFIVKYTYCVLDMKQVALHYSMKCLHLK